MFNFLHDIFFLNWRDWYGKLGSFGKPVSWSLTGRIYLTIGDILMLQKRKWSSRRVHYRTKVAYAVHTYVKRVDDCGDERFKVDDIICNRVLLHEHRCLLLSAFCGKIRIRNIYCRYNHGIPITSIAIYQHIF